MNRYKLVMAVLLCLLITNEGMAQRRGGGRSFSGGRNFSSPQRTMNRPAARPAGGYNRPSSVPNFQRPSNFKPPTNYRPSTNRPVTNRPVTSRPNVNRPSTNPPRNFSNGNNLQRPNFSGNSKYQPSVATNRGTSRPDFSPNRSNAKSGQFNRPTNNQLNDFLNMPKNANSNRTNTATKNDYGGRTYEGDKFTVETFKGKGSGSKGDTKYGGAGAGVVITDSQGNQRVVGKGVGGASDGTNKVAGKGSVAGGKNVDGSAGAVRQGTRVGTDGNSVGVAKGTVGGVRDSQGNVRGGAAGGYRATDGETTVGGAGSVRGQKNTDGSGGYIARGARGATDGTNTVVQRGASAGARDRYGNARGGAVGGTKVSDGVNSRSQIRGGRYVKDPAGNVYARGFRANTYNGIVTNYNQVFAIRNGFTGYTRYFRPGWYVRYPGAWVAAGIVATAWWNAPTYGYVAGYCGYEDEPVSYDYGNEGIYVENGNVYIGDEAIASETEYYEQAEQIADGFEEPEENEDDQQWLPLGVFAVVSEGQTKSDKTLQLAVNKDGMIRGNLIVDMTDQVIPVHGTVNKETQRVAIRLEGKEKIVVEAGLYNLTQDVLTVLVHFGEDRQEERGLVRLMEDESDPESIEDGAADQ